MIGKGKTAEVYEYGADKVCKLFFEGYPKEYIELEFHNAILMYDLEINVPKPYEIITFKNRNGIIYEKIFGKTLYECMSNNEEGMIEVLVSLHHDLLSFHTQELISYKDFLSAIVGNHSASEGLLLDIQKLPDDDCLLHGDFHPYNILLKSNDEPVVIDFMNVCYGPALYDIARTHFLLEQNNKLFAKRYLVKMNVNENDIKIYSDIIKRCRSYEI